MERWQCLTNVYPTTRLLGVGGRHCLREEGSGSGRITITGCLQQCLRDEYIVLEIIQRGWCLRIYGQTVCQR